MPKVLLVQRPRAIDFTELCVAEGKTSTGSHGRILVADLAKEPHALLEERLCCCGIALLGERVPKRPERVGSALSVGETTMQAECLFRATPAGCRISGDDRYRRRGVESLRTGRGGSLVSPKRSLQATDALRQIAPQVPEIRQSACQPQGELRLTRRFEEVEGSPKVVVLALPAIHPLRGTP